MSQYRNKLESLNNEIIKEIETLSNTLGEPCANYNFTDMLRVEGLNIRVRGEQIKYVNNDVAISESNHQHPTNSINIDELCDIVDYFK